MSEKYSVVAKKDAEILPADANSLHSGPFSDLRPKVETFVQRYVSHGSASRAYREAFDCDPNIRPNTVHRRAWELVHRPDVAARVRTLLAQAAGDAVAAAKARMTRLEMIAATDVSEVLRIVREPCKDCWTGEALTGAMVHGRVPDTSEVRDDCPTCKGDGARRVVLTPTDELSAGARMLIRSIRSKADGEIEVRLVDRLEAVDMVNRMQGSYAPERHLDVSARVHVDFAAMGHEQQLAFLESLRPAK